MKRWIFRCSILLIVILLFLISAEPPEENEQVGEKLVVWVYFKDKDTSAAMKMSPYDFVSERSFTRRAKVLPKDSLIGGSDWPLNQNYVREISRRVTVRQRSKWFNGVSAEGTVEELRALEKLDFVKSVDICSRLEGGAKKNPAEPEIKTTASALISSNFNYGPSFFQLFQIGVTKVHARGNYGQGVLIGLFDAGFLLSHEVFNSINIVATYDFVENKETVVPSNPLFGAHGLNTLSVIGGYMPGKLIGAAFGASFVLARTEDVASETPVEEDNWVAAIEWADSIGVDIVSSSLGYFNYDKPYRSMTSRDMDGKTSLIVRAAQLAAKKGILVVNSVGNEGRGEVVKVGELLMRRSTIISPADGEDVLAVGAVDFFGKRVYFSSTGPTSDFPPRIKPDVMAPGKLVYAADVSSDSAYERVSGTSFSCPLVAGVAALILNVCPQATPKEIIEALKATATMAKLPNNEYGWGVVDAEKAIRYIKHVKRKK
jgi:subtilisin family serine protease